MGSNVFEVNPWLWQFGRCKPRLGGLSMTESKDRRIAVPQDGAKHGHATRTKRMHTASVRKARCGGERSRSDIMGVSGVIPRY